MNVKPNDIIKWNLSLDRIKISIDNARLILKNIHDRTNLHSRDDLERFEDILLGEVAEQIVLEWLIHNGKYAESAIEKGQAGPDSGHDIWVMGIDNQKNRLL